MVLRNGLFSSGKELNGKIERERALWGDSMNWSILALLIHGLGLFVALVIVNCVIVPLPQLFFPGFQQTS